MMKHLLCISLLACSTTFVMASEIDGDYDCKGTGLRIKGNEAIYGSTKFKKIGVEGLVHYFGNEDYKKGSYSPHTFIFDEVTHLSKILTPERELDEKVECKLLR